jgi:hypothetical protein
MNDHNSLKFSPRIAFFKALSPHICFADLTRHVLLFLPFFLTVSCSYTAPAAFPFLTENGLTLEVRAHSKQAASGLIQAQEKPVKYDYSLPETVPVLDNASFVIDYTVKNAGDHALIPEATATIIAIRFGDDKNGGPSWQLPLDSYFLGLDSGPDSGPDSNAEPGRYRYAVPLDTPELAKITISAEHVSGMSNTSGISGIEIQIRSFSVAQRFYGFEEDSRGMQLSPFVYREVDAESQNARYVINPAEPYTIDGGKSLRVKNLSPRSVIKTRAFGYESSRFATREVSLPAGILGRSPYPITVDGDAAAVMLAPFPIPEFPVPIVADPGVILDYPQTVWRNDGYEVFRWESFPDALIFDTADYEVQDRLFKRLAFFVEKKGYRGRLVSDQDLAGQHAWNAHDYRAEDLAAFYERARLQNFPLLPEELTLRTILIDNGIIKMTNGSVAAGKGAIVSISRESNGYLRRLFMAHECFHGIFFIDEDFRNFAQQRYDGLDPVSKRVLLSYFDYQAYDITDEYLVVNEFMAYLLQQSVGAAVEYFGKTVPERLESSSWRYTVLPEKDEARGVWPHLATSFEREARALSDYAAQRWQLSGGRTWLIE